MPKFIGKSSLCTLALLLTSNIAFSQAAPRALTSADYAAAEKFMGYNTTPLVSGTVRANWLPDNRFWYRNTTAQRSDFVLFDPAKGKGEPAFDHAKLAA